MLRNTVEEGVLYAKQVVDGTIFVADDTKLGCQRFLNYLERGGYFGAQDATWNYYFHEASANHVLEFVNSCKHVKGALTGQMMRLEPFQVMVLCWILGFIHKDRHTRMVQNVLLFIVRKQGKSFFCSILSLYLLLFPNGLATMMLAESGTEIFVTAVDRSQAKIVFNAAQALLESMPKGLSQRYRLMRDSIHKSDDRLSLFTTLSRDAKKSALGKQCSCHIVDEAALIDADSIQAVNSGMLGRHSPLVIYITTAHYSRDSLLYEHLSYCKAMLRNQAPDNERWMYLGYYLPEGVEWTDPKGWYASAPLLGKTIPEEAYRTMCEEAQAKPMLRNEFLCRNLNAWINVDSAFIDQNILMACPHTKPEGHPDFVAIACDLAMTRDLNCVAVVQRFDDLIWIDFKCFLPKDSMLYIPDFVRPIFERAVDAGELHLTDGNVADYGVIHDHILAEYQKHSYMSTVHLGYDPWNANALVQRLQESTGVQMEPIGQGLQSLSSSTKEFFKLAHEKKLGFADSKLFYWSASVATLYIDPNENWKLKKMDSHSKIDPIVASVMALKIILNQPVFGVGVHNA